MDPDQIDRLELAFLPLLTSIERSSEPMGRPVTHWQILAKDPDRLADFYSKLFSWKVESENALGYRTVDPGGDRGIPGGFWPAGPEGHSFVQLFIDVDDVQQYLSRALEIGASVVIPPQALPDGGELTIVRDVEGIPFGLMSAAKGSPGRPASARRKHR